ncbi:MAG: crosslink repair DNA glycosylase YcaQ family protein [Kouleothrix sp.]
MRALGITTAGWVADYFRSAKRATAGLLPELAAAGQLIEVQVEGGASQATCTDNAALALAAADGVLVPRLTTLLSPLRPTA